MTVVFDLLGFQNRDHGERGIARYVLNLALALEKHHPDFVDQFLVHPHLPLPSGAERLIGSGKLTRADRETTLRTPSGGGTFIAGSLIELQEPLDVALPTWARTPAWRTAAVLYDLIPLRFEELYLSNPSVRFPYKSRVAALASVDRLLAISQASADDAKEFLGVNDRQLSVIYAGADEQFRPADAPYRAVAEALTDDIPGLRPGFVLFPTGIEPRKNVDRTMEAYAALPRRVRAAHQLALVCRITDHDRAALAERATELGIADDLLVTGYVSDEMLVRLYQGAELVVFPSLYEGFGLPPFEALRCGAPVICSDSSSLREVQQDPDMRFDPGRVEAITEALADNLPCDAPADVIRRQPTPDYSWERAASTTVDALRSAERVTTCRPRRRRLALVSPLPPQRSGIATYAARMLEHLKHRFEITVFHDPDMGDVEAIEGVMVEPLSRLGPIRAGGGDFDRILYFMGNSTFHVEALEALESHPGWVMFHDARLSGLYSEVRRLHPERLHQGSVGRTVAALYPWRYRPQVEEEEVISPDLADRFGILMTREVAGLAVRCLVHSHYAAELIELDSGVRPIVPFPIPAPREDSIEGGRSAQPVVISTFGLVAPVKCPELLIRALAIVRSSVPDAELHFVGGIDPRYEEQLGEIAVGAGVADVVVFSNHVTDEEFRQAQQRTTIAVQLRAFTNGESSAAVSETLAHGLPTIVSDIGAMAELPKEAVVHFDHDDGVDGLASRLIALLESPAGLDRLRTASRQYAHENGFERAAQRLADLLDEDITND